MNGGQPPPDPVSYIMDSIYAFNVQMTDFIQKTAKEVASSEQFNQALDWINYSKDQILERVENLPPITKEKALAILFPNGEKAVAAPPPPPPQTTMQKLFGWIGTHKLMVGVILVGATGTAYAGYRVQLNRYHAKRRRRRAHKAANGARIEAVVLASSPREPIAKIIAADLERRGFIVFITVQPGEEHLVLKEDSPDIRPLIMPSPDSTERSVVVEKFADVVDRNEHLAGVIILPDLYYPTGPVESINAFDWSDVLYSKVVGSVALLSQGFIPLVRRHNARFLLLTPSILPSLCPPFHAPECVTASALSAFALCMQRELAPQGIPFVHMRLGSFDMSVAVPSTYSSSSGSPFMGQSPSGTHSPTGSHARSYSPATSPCRSVNNTIRADMLSWPENIRTVYGKAYGTVARAISGTASSIASTASPTRHATGSPLKELTLAIVDCLTSDDPRLLRRTQFVGKGSYMFYVLGGLIPEATLEWVLGVTQSSPTDFFRTIPVEAYADRRTRGDDAPDSPLSSGASGSAYNSETESHPDLTSSWERV